MSSVLDNRNPVGLIANIGLAIAVAAVGNGIIFLLGWSGEVPGRQFPAFQPPGWVIGLVWMALFAALGAARWLTAQSHDSRGRRNARLITALIVICFAYPYYTVGFRSLELGLAGSIATMVIAVSLAWRVAQQSRIAGFLVLATGLWCAFASVLVLRTLQINA